MRENHQSAKGTRRRQHSAKNRVGLSRLVPCSCHGPTADTTIWGVVLLRMEQFDRLPPRVHSRGNRFGWRFHRACQLPRRPRSCF